MHVEEGLGKGEGKNWFKLFLKELWRWLKGPAAWSVLWLQVN